MDDLVTREYTLLVTFRADAATAMEIKQAMEDAANALIQPTKELASAVFARGAEAVVKAAQQEREADGTLLTAKCECGHYASNHVMLSQQQRCEATVYTDAPLGGGNAYPCPCRQFSEATS